jgi:hypothetical protein
VSPDFRAASATGLGLWNHHGAKFYGHWNSAGHAVAAQAMLRYFEPLLSGAAVSTPGAHDSPRPVSR